MRLHRMAAARGFAHWRPMAATITAGELVESLAFESLEPNTRERDDIHHALLMSLLYAAHSGKGTPKKQPDDFLPFKPPQTEEAMQATIRGLFAKKTKGEKKAKR